MWTYYKYILTHLKCSNRLGLKAPHKSIYLLSVLDLIDADIIRNGKFYITPLLIKRFEINWNNLVSDASPFKCNIWNPITYMEEEIIRKMYYAGVEEKKITSLQRCQSIIEHFEIPSDLWRILLIEEKRNELRTLIIENYITNKYTTTRRI